MPLTYWDRFPRLQVMQIERTRSRHHLPTQRGNLWSLKPTSAQGRACTVSGIGS